jgi:hypothetical protein
MFMILAAVRATGADRVFPRRVFQFFVPIKRERLVSPDIALFRTSAVETT